jgi:hypothetical protein
VKEALLGYDVREIGTDGYKVTKSAGRLGRRRAHTVSWSEQRCTCLTWQQRGYPCRHAIAVAQQKDGGALLSVSACRFGALQLLYKQFPVKIFLLIF